MAAKPKRIPEHELAHIAEPLRPLAVALSDLHEDPRNVNQHNQRSIDEISRSLQQFQQLKPIVVRAETMHVVAGNGTYRACVQNGWKYVAATVKSMTEHEAQAYAIADNRTASFGEINEELLQEILQELEDSGTYTAADLGYNPDELDKLINAALEQPEPTHEVKPIEEKEPGSGPATKDKYELLIILETEEQQTDLLNRLMEEGYKCKALIG